MKNQFEDSMSKRTDEVLAEIVNNRQNDYRPDAIKAAEQEIKKREQNTGKFSKFSDEQILEILKSRNDYQPYEVAKAEAEAEKRKLKFDFKEEKIEAEINHEIQKLKEDVIRERYPALRFISGVYRFLAWLVIILAAIGSLFALSQGQYGIPVVIGALLIGGLLFVTLLATAEGIKVFIDIEHNTRITASNSKK